MKRKFWKKKSKVFETRMLALTFIDKCLFCKIVTSLISTGMSHFIIEFCFNEITVLLIIISVITNSCWWNDMIMLFWGRGRSFIKNWRNAIIWIMVHLKILFVHSWWMGKYQFMDRAYCRYQYNHMMKSFMNWYTW